jgi:hypothetical protein
LTLGCSGIFFEAKIVDSIWEEEKQVFPTKITRFLLSTSSPQFLHGRNSNALSGASAAEILILSRTLPGETLTKP